MKTTGFQGKVESTAASDALAQTIKEFETCNGDCAQFAARYYELLTGQNPARLYQYADLAEANAIVASEGGLESVFTKHIGVPSRLPAVPGDVVLCDISNDGSLIAAGVFNGFYVWSYEPTHGLFRTTKERIVAAWPLV